MKLYYSPGACSLSPHIVLLESGLPFEAKMTSTKTHKLADGTDFYAINAKGYVPVLEFDNGERLTEGPAIVQWIADQAPDRHLAPPPGSMARYRLQEWLNFVTSELHKGYGPIFNPAMPDEAKALARTKLIDRFKIVDAQLGQHDYLLGDTFSVADAYLYTVTRWAAPMQVDLSAYANLSAFMKRVDARPTVQKALQDEGLTQKA